MICYCGKALGSLRACPWCGRGFTRSGTKAVRARKNLSPYRRPHATAPTSRASYAGLRHLDTQGQYAAILRALDENPGGLTRRELHHATSIGYEAICGRADELMGKHGRGPFVEDPLLAELPTLRKNKDTGVAAAVLVRAAKLGEIVGRLEL